MYPRLHGKDVAVLGRDPTLLRSQPNSGLFPSSLSCSLPPIAALHVLQPAAFRDWNFLTPKTLTALPEHPPMSPLLPHPHPLDFVCLWFCRGEKTKQPEVSGRPYSTLPIREQTIIFSCFDQFIVTVYLDGKLQIPAPQQLGAMWCMQRSPENTGRICPCS